MKKNTPEHDLQSACVKWFDRKYPNIIELLFSVPNAGLRSISQGAKFKREGLRAGVADIILSFQTGSVPLTYFEFKSPTGSQSDEQKVFEDIVTGAGFRYFVIKDIETFKTKVQDYEPELSTFNQTFITKNDWISKLTALRKD